MIHGSARLLSAGAVTVALLAMSACAGGEEQATGGAAASKPETRVVEHAMGKTEVPADPERVVVLDTGELDDALALGVKPVGAVRADVSRDFLSYLDDEQTAGIEMVGTITEPNLEKIAGLRPDLILSSTVRHEAIYPRLSDIAPTVLAPDVGDTWKQNFLLYADALGRKAKAEQMIADFEARAEDLGAKLDSAEPITVGVVRFVPGQIRLYGETSFIGTIFSDVGVQVPADARGKDVDTYVELSSELIDKANADQLIVSTYGPAGDTDQDAILGGPLWKRLDAVEEGRVEHVDDDVWMTGIGIQAANHTLDDLEKLLPSGSE